MISARVDQFVVRIITQIRQNADTRDCPESPAVRCRFGPQLADFVFLPWSWCRCRQHDLIGAEEIADSEQLADGLGDFSPGAERRNALSFSYDQFAVRERRDVDFQAVNLAWLRTRLAKSSSAMSSKDRAAAART